MQEKAEAIACTSSCKGILARVIDDEIPLFCERRCCPINTSIFVEGLANTFPVNSSYFQMNEFRFQISYRSRFYVDSDEHEVTRDDALEY